MPDQPPSDHQPDSFIARLRAGQVMYGPLLFELATPGLAVTLADAGFDFLLFDLEHAPFDAPTVARTMLAARQAGLASIVKITDLERSAVQRFLDYGATAIQVPHVESPEEVERLARWARYPPVGERGQVFGLGNTGFRSVDPRAYVAEANDQILLMPMIETRRGVERVESILDTGGANAVFIGTGDLSSSYGVPGQMTHPIVLEAAERVLAACRERGIFVAINAEEPEVAARWADRGVQMIAYSSELLMIRRQAKILFDFLSSRG